MFLKLWVPNPQGVAIQSKGRRRVIKNHLKYNCTHGACRKCSCSRRKVLRIVIVREDLIAYCRCSKVVKLFKSILPPYSLIYICDNVQNCTFRWSAVLERSYLNLCIISGDALSQSPASATYGTRAKRGTWNDFQWHAEWIEIQYMIS
jgi:hypothetical protein